MKCVKWLQWENAEEWGEIECPMLDGENIMTYAPKGYPVFYSYTAPFVDADLDVCYYRFDHDEGMWEDVIFCIGEYKEGIRISFS